MQTHKGEGPAIAVEARHFTCQFGCTAQDAQPEFGPGESASRKDHQQGLPLAISRFCPITNELSVGGGK